MRSTLAKWFLFLLPVVLAVVLFATIKQAKSPPVQADVAEQARPVRVIHLEAVAVTPKLTGHGTARPVRVWEGVAQASGRVISKHPGLQRGEIISQGELLVEIDPTDYQLKIAQTEADLAATNAQLDELDVRESNTRIALTIEEEALGLALRELERKRELAGKGGVSTSDLENQQRAVLGQRQSVQSQRNTLALIPSQRALLLAQRSRHEANLATLRRDLEQTELKLPFTGRIAEVHFELEQFVREGEMLLVADDLSAAEVEVQVPINRFAALLHRDTPLDLLDQHGSIVRQLDLSAVVRLQEEGLNAEWPARFSRVSDTLDPKARTIGLIVEVDAPYANVTPGVRPPLLKGLFVEVELSGPVREGALIVPPQLLHEGYLPVVDEGNRLRLLPVESVLQQPGFLVVSGPFNVGSRVVVSDLTPAIEGMLLAPERDEQLENALRSAAGTR